MLGIHHDAGEWWPLLCCGVITVFVDVILVVWF